MQLISMFRLMMAEACRDAQMAVDCARLLHSLFGDCCVGDENRRTNAARAGCLQIIQFITCILQPSCFLRNERL
jgi:hypothetical protein